MASIPKCQSLTTVPIKTSNFRYFPIIVDHQNKQLYAIHKERGILQYSFDENMWNKYKTIENLADLPSEFFYHATPSTVIDSEERMYLCTSKGHLATLKIDAPDSLNFHVIDTGRDLMGARARMIESELHIIGSHSDHDRNYKHLRFNTKTDTFDTVCNAGFGWPQLIKMKDKLLSFGGYSGDKGYLNKIYEYDIKSNKWERSMQNMPEASIVDGVASVLNEQLILLFGGYDGIECVRKIWIYSMKDEVFTQSKVRCPGRRGGKVLTMNDAIQDELTVFGYIRSQWSECKIHDHLFPPRYLIKIMSKYYMKQWVYLIEDKGGLWKIDVFDIINNVQD